MHLRRSTRDARPQPTGLDATAALPDNALEMVLAALPLPERVRSGVLSKRFLALSRQASLYAHLSFEQMRRPGMITLLALCRRAGSELRSLDIRALPVRFTVSYDALVSPHAHDLLAVEAVALALEAIAPCRLQSLRLSTKPRYTGWFIRWLGFSASYDPVTDAELLRLRTACPKLSFFGGLYTQAHNEDCVESLRRVLRSLPAAGDVTFQLRTNTPAARMHDFVLAICEKTSLVTGLKCKANDDGFIAALAGELIACNARLRRLELDGTRIGPAGADALARLIASCDSLEYLDVYGQDALPEKTLFGAACARRAPLEIRYCLLADAPIPGLQRAAHTAHFGVGGV